MLTGAFGEAQGRPDGGDDLAGAGWWLRGSQTFMNRPAVSSGERFSRPRSTNRRMDGVSPTADHIITPSVFPRG